jgi:hypothetical protein
MSRRDISWVALLRILYSRSVGTSHAIELQTLNVIRSLLPGKPQLNRPDIVERSALLRRSGYAKASRNCRFIVAFSWSTPAFYSVLSAAIFALVLPPPSPGKLPYFLRE